MSVMIIFSFYLHYWLSIAVILYDIGWDGLVMFKKKWQWFGENVKDFKLGGWPSKIWKEIVKKILEVII